MKLPAQVSAAVRKRNPEVFETGGKGGLEKNDPIVVAKTFHVKTTKLAEPGVRLRQSKAPKMNKLEAEWFGKIKDRYPNYPPVRPQAKRYQLCNGVTYSPDFSCSVWPDEDGGPARETAWEVKGPKAWDDALVKIKMAAHKWPEINWYFVWKDKGQWKQQKVLP